MSKLSERTELDVQKCEIINNIVEDNFLVGNKNKVKIIERFVKKINLSTYEANNIYNEAMSIISSGIYEKLKYLFKDKG